MEFNFPSGSTLVLPTPVIKLMNEETDDAVTQHKKLEQACPGVQVDERGRAVYPSKAKKKGLACELC
jgi:hypothetical protein